MDTDYAEFLKQKTPRPQSTGVKPGQMPAHLFDFQQSAVSFAVERGRCGLYFDTGLGKTRMQLEWADQSRRAANGKALILTPLAVARQIEREGAALGYNIRVIREQSEARDGINVCNYDRLDKIDPAAFGVVSLDESSVLKSFTGKTTRALIESFAGHRFKMCATATPAPNDHMELGQQAEFLGIMPASEMLMRWFINDTSNASQNWRIKGHAEESFWDWMAGWSRMASSPADMGFDGSRYVLPELRIIRHRATGDIRPASGSLFVQELSATNIHDIKRQTADTRADIVAGLVADDPSEAWVIWCDTDYEADALRKRIPAAGEVRGSHTIDRKEETLAAFASGDIKALITKPSVTGYGLNWQHAARMAFVGRSFSYESWYQAVRRCWRFGQTRPVDCHIVVAEGEEQIGRVIDRKADDHATMKAAMANAMSRAVHTASKERVPYTPTHSGRLPSWL